MKLINTCLLLGLIHIDEAQAIYIKERNADTDLDENADYWGDSLAGIDINEYTRDVPNEYKIAEPPKVDVELELKKKAFVQAQSKEELAHFKEITKLEEDLNNHLKTFSRTLDAKEFHKVLDTKKNLEREINLLRILGLELKNCGIMVLAKRI